MREIDRRKFLGGLAAIAGTSLVGCRTASEAEEDAVTLPPTTQDLAGLGMEEADAPTMADGRAGRADDARPKRTARRSRPRRCARCTRATCANDPLPQAIATAQGRARLELADEPMQIVMRLKVPDFGEVYCFADNDGRGYTRRSSAIRRRLRRDAPPPRARARGTKLEPTGLEMDRAISRPPRRRVAADPEGARHRAHRRRVRIARARPARGRDARAGEREAPHRATRQAARTISSSA